MAWILLEGGDEEGCLGKWVAMMGNAAAVDGERISARVLMITINEWAVVVE